MQQYHLHTPATFAATACGIAFAALIIIFPIILTEITQMEEELALHRGQYQTMSDTIWQYLMEENQQLRLTRAVRRNRSQYDGVGEENGYGKGIAENGGVKGENGCPRGPPGPPGEPGEKGVNGLDGIPGKDGIPGIAAVPYAASEKGPCAPCPPGRPGLRGYKGKRGPRGPIGKKGEIGMPGRDGAVGDEGPEGDIGPVGPQGLPGEKGLPGLDGYQYIRGLPGEKGEPGPQGPEGDQGPPGERGDQGEQGLPGEPGRPGPPGPEGLTGVPGSEGQPGSVGADAEYCPCPARDGKGYDTGYEQTEKSPASKTVESTNGLADVYQKIKPEGKTDKVTGTTKKPPGIRTKNGQKEKPLGNGYPPAIGKPDEAQTAQPYKKAVFA